MTGIPTVLDERFRAAAELVAAERREERGRARELRQLHRGDGASSCRLLPGLERVDDLARLGRVVDARELHPLDMSDDGEVHDLTS